MGAREDIIVRMGLDGSKLHSGLDSAMQKMRGFNEGIGKIGLGSVMSIGMIGMAFKSVLDYAEQLPASIGGFAAETRKLAIGWNDFKEASVATAASVIGFLTTGHRKAGEFIGDMINWARYGKEGAERIEMVNAQADANIERMKTVEESNKRIGESVKKRAENEQKLVPIGEQIRQAQQELVIIQDKYNTTEGDIVTKKKLQEQVEEAKLKLSNLLTSEKQAQLKVEEQMTAASKSQAEAALATATHQERINYWLNLAASEKKKADDASKGVDERGKARLEVARALAAAGKEESDWKARIALSGAELLEYASLTSKHADQLNAKERARLSILQAQIKLNENREKINEILADKNVTAEEAKRVAEIQKQNDQLNKQIALKQSIIDNTIAQAKAEASVSDFIAKTTPKVTEEYGKQSGVLEDIIAEGQQILADKMTSKNVSVAETVQLQQQLEILKEKKAKLDELNARSAPISGDMGTMKILGGIRTYDNPLDQKRYEQEREKFARQGIEEEIAMWEKKLAQYRRSGSSAGGYEENAIRARIRGLEGRESNIGSYLWDPNYKDSLGSGIFAQQVATIGDPLGLQGQKQSATLDSIDSGIRDINTRLRLADLPKQ